MTGEELDRAMSYWDRYTDEQLRAAFALVKTPGNWKLPIDAIVPGDADTRLIDNAVVYYTGGLAEIIPQADGTLRAVSGGYYANIGS